MKKFFFCAVAVLATSFAARAEMPAGPKNIFGIRGGMNVSTISGNGITFDSKVGFHVGVVDQVRLSSKLPFYLETGLSFSNKGFGGFSAMGGGASEGTNLYYLQVPAMINFRWEMGKNFTLDPQVGFYYGYCVFSDYKMHDQLNTSDFGMRVGVGASWKKLHFGLGYEFGFLPLMQGANTGTNGCFTLSVGVNFASKAR